MHGDNCAPGTATQDLGLKRGTRVRGAAPGSVTYVCTEDGSTISSPFFSRVTGTVRRRTFGDGCFVHRSFATVSVTGPSVTQRLTRFPMSKVMVLKQCRGRLLHFFARGCGGIVCANLGPVKARCSRMIYSKDSVSCDTLSCLIRLKRAGVNCMNRRGGRMHFDNCGSTLTGLKLPFLRGGADGMRLSTSNNCGNTGVLVRGGTSVSTVFYTGSAATLKIVRTLGRGGFQVPRSVSIVDMSSVRATRCLSPVLAAMRVPLRRLKEVATGALVSHVGNKRHLPVHVSLPFCVTGESDYKGLGEEHGAFTDLPPRWVK